MFLDWWKLLTWIPQCCFETEVTIGQFFSERTVHIASLLNMYFLLLFLDLNIGFLCWFIDSDKTEEKGIKRSTWLCISSHRHIHDADVFILNTRPVLFYRDSNVLYAGELSLQHTHRAIEESFCLVNSSISEGMSQAILEVRVV